MEIRVVSSQPMPFMAVRRLRMSEVMMCSGRGLRGGRGVDS